MKDLTTVPYFAPVEKLSEILCAKTQTADPLFFRISTSYYLAKVASMMRCNIKTLDRGLIPVSMYALNLATSGHGKGHSTNILEEQVINQFQKRFLNHSYKMQAEKNVAQLAVDRCKVNRSDQQTEHDKAMIEFDRTGPLLFSFDSGTSPAVKQLRHKLLMSGAGSMNLEIDEIGSHLIGQQDILDTYLELYDMGKLKPKLIKNTKESIRDETIDGRTPTNMLLFGTPAKLLNNGKTEEEFYSMLETGYARRCIFGYSKSNTFDDSRTAQDIYDMLTDTSNDLYLQKISQHIGKLANQSFFDHELDVSKDVTLELISYKMECEKLASQLPDYEEVRKTELEHRYFKSLKLAGAYAFYDSTNNITSDHLWSAIKLVEDSGAAFDQILTRDKAYVKLAKYISSVNHEVTHADLTEDLPFYAVADNQRKAMLELAVAWGYKNNVVIKKTYADNIEFLSGDSLEETNMDELFISSSNDIAVGYGEAKIQWPDMVKLTQTNGYHFINHHLINDNRKEEHCIPGFNLAIIDVDGGISIDTAKWLIKDYTYFLYTTKRHTAQNNRFRVVFPMSHIVQLDADDYTKFMNNFFDSLPFEVDRATAQRARKWLACDGTYEYHDGKLVDALLFIPKTSKSEAREKQVASMANLDATERWFAMNTEKGDRSNKLLRYALMLVDTGRNIDDIENAVLAFNSKLADGLENGEIHSTILRTAGKAVIARDSK